MCVIFISKVLMSAPHVLRRDHTVLPATHTFMCIWNEPLPAFTPKSQSITALWPVLISRPAQGRRLSWPGWIGEVLSLPARRQSHIQY